MVKSQKMKRFWTQLWTYAYLLILSIIILFPLAVTISSAFRSGNVTAFTLDLAQDWTLKNFERLFNDTLYVRWYTNTLIVPSLPWPSR